MEKYSDPRKIIEWLEVLQHLPDATRTRQAAFAWIRVFCGRNNFSKRVRIMRKATFICARVLYESKIRLDHVCMRLWRQLWEGFNYMEFDINLWMDGSPQWRGLELFASVFDITSSDGMFYRRRRFPQLSLERHQLDAYSKVLAIVWQIFLSSDCMVFAVFVIVSFQFVAIKVSSVLSRDVEILLHQSSDSSASGPSLAFLSTRRLQMYFLAQYFALAGDISGTQLPVEGYPTRHFSFRGSNVSNV